MSIQEILEAHGIVWESNGDYGDIAWVECDCSTNNGDDAWTGDGESDHRAHVAEVLEKHMQEREAAAAREAARYIERLYTRNGLVSRADVLADLEIAADRLGRGVYANGRDKEPTNGR